MEIFLIIIGVILGILGVSGFILGLTEDGPGMFIVSIFFLIFSATCLYGALHNSSFDNQDSVQNNSTESQSTTNDSSSNNASSSSVQTSQWPRDWPGDNAKYDVKNKWWQDWADDQLTNEATISCKDGVQIVLLGEVDASGHTNRVSAFVRLHQDGKPYSCNESKDPAKEVSL
jgi:hypothetical protein